MDESKSPPPAARTGDESNAHLRDSIKSRGKPSSEGRFIWQSKAVIMRILSEMGTQAAYGIAVYCALSRISSENKNDPTFQAAVDKIAGMSGLSYRKTFDVLNSLEERVKVITITPSERRKGDVKQPANRYTLLSIGSKHNMQPARRRNVQPPDCTRITNSCAEIQTVDTEGISTSRYNLRSSTGLDEEKENGNNSSAASAQALPDGSLAEAPAVSKSPSGKPSITGGW